MSAANGTNGAAASAPAPAVSDPIADLLAATKELTGAVDEFTSQAAGAGQTAASGHNLNLGQRRRIIDAASRILDAAKDPVDQWMDVTAQSALFTANRLLFQWGVFEAIPLEGSISYAELAAKVDADPVLIRRVAGVPTSVGLLRQVGADEVAHTPKSKIFVGGNPAGLVYNMAWENGLYPYAHMPNFFEKYGKKEPQTMNHVPTTWAYGHPEWSYYEMLAHDPAWMGRFLKAMGPIEARMPISGIYDFGWLVAAAEADPAGERPLFVDVGGGKGQAIVAIRKEFPGLPLGRCVLQDRPEVIAAGAALDEEDLRGVQRMAMDFHKEQPVKGAAVYWIRRCLHNYGDQVGVNMLKQVVGALAEDSKVLLQEDVMDNPPSHSAAMLDLMMLGFGGKQRTIEMWEAVVGEAGLKIDKVVRGTGPWKSLSVIECTKK